jgi:uncharacterized membrane protein YphA (DoxX/SURF4 family)
VAAQGARTESRRSAALSCSRGPTMPVALLAHATWFTEGRPAIDLSFATQPLPLALLAASVAIMVLARRLSDRRPWPELAPLRPLGRLGPWIPRLLAAHVGVSLLAMAFRGEYLAPSLSLPSNAWGILLMAVEAIIGVWFLLGVRVRPAAWLLVAAGPLGALAFGALPILERIDLLGIAAFLALLPPDDAHPAGRVRLEWDQLRPALLALRLLAGTALIVVAVTEKLARPELTLEFLQQHPAFNLAQLVGLPISDELFIVVAAAVEILFGLLIISGALPQLVGLATAATFLLPVPILGTPELLGHLPIYGVALALVAFGSHPATATACRWLPRRHAAPNVGPGSADVDSTSPFAASRS